MVGVHTIIMVLAFVCFSCAAFNVSSRVNLIGAGLALWTLSLLVL